MKKFENDDRAYLSWLQSHPNGFVLNVRRLPDPDYVVLHRASCGSISSKKNAENAYTGRLYRKVCALAVDELAKAAKAEGRKDGTFSKRCKLCSA